jgi:hypothetical protein
MEATRDTMSAPKANEGSEVIDRFDVGIRIAYSLLFAAIMSALQSISALIVTFQLVYSLITQSVPSGRVQAFANGLVAYIYQILRYLTHNDALIPFPFSDFPEPLEPTKEAYAARRRVKREDESRFGEDDCEVEGEVEGEED